MNNIRDKKHDHNIFLTSFNCIWYKYCGRIIDFETDRVTRKTSIFQFENIVNNDFLAPKAHYGEISNAWN